MDFKETVTSTADIYSGKVFDVKKHMVILPDGHTTVREAVLHNGGVGIIAIDNKKEVFMVRQYRFGADTVTLEIPAGKLEKGEDPFEAGKRELKEETGAVANKYISLGKLYPTPGYCGEIIHMYLATELTFGEQSPDEDEFLEVYKISLEKAVEMVMNGELPDSKTQTMILKINQLKNEGKI